MQVKVGDSEPEPEPEALRLARACGPGWDPMRCHGASGAEPLSAGPPAGPGEVPGNLKPGHMMEFHFRSSLMADRLIRPLRP